MIGFSVGWRVSHKISVRNSNDPAALILQNDLAPSTIVGGEPNQGRNKIASAIGQAVWVT
jgi:hypothetical protein